MNLISTLSKRLIQYFYFFCSKHYIYKSKYEYCNKSLNNKGLKQDIVFSFYMNKKSMLKIFTLVGEKMRILLEFFSNLSRIKIYHYKVELII
jgi:hypothetical protein